MSDKDEQMMSAPAEEYRARKIGEKRSRKWMKLVYPDGSYFVVEHSEAKRIGTISKYIFRKREAYLKQMSKDLRIDRSVLIKTIRALAGVKSIYKVHEDGKEERVSGGIISVKKGHYNPIRNKPGTPQYLKDNIIISRAGA